MNNLIFKNISWFVELFYL